jgi:uncharacterized glyoxalase superfamily protein PhnB
MERAVPILPADDLAVAKRFYVDGLGFRISFEASDEGRTGILGLERGTLRVTVDSPMSGHGRHACVALEVDDADAYYGEWSAKVAVLRPPRDESWEGRTFDLADPFGNTLFVIGPRLPSRHSARIVHSRAVLAVRDLVVSTRYYKEVLGFAQDPIDADGWSFLTRDNFSVMIGECANEKPASELGDHSYVAYWNVDKVDQFYTDLVARGALITSQPTDKPWGLREFTLRTPDGHRITCGQSIAGR